MHTTVQEHIKSCFGCQTGKRLVSDEKTPLKRLPVLKQTAKKLVRRRRRTPESDEARQQVHSRSHLSILYVDCANTYSRSDSHDSLKGFI